MEMKLKNKWLRYWLGLAMFIVGFIWYVTVHISKNDWNNAILQFGAILIPLFAALIIMGQNNEQIEKATKEQLNHLQQLTEKQISALQESTNRQIENYAKQTEKVVEELLENSILLGEILNNDIGNAIAELDLKILTTEKDLQNHARIYGLSDDIQIDKMNQAIARLKHQKERLIKKHKQLEEEGFFD
ncbi:MAG: hypothetical protein JST82_10935 [Bacteroidetes bacterium]|nr:hypothetical protein [Bacteroidota bacterium]